MKLRAIGAGDFGGVDFEILVMIDRGDAATKECAARYREKARILESNFEMCTGAEFMRRSRREGDGFFVDGDDLVSRGYVEGRWGVLGATDEEIVGVQSIVLGFRRTGEQGRC